MSDLNWVDVLDGKIALGHRPKLKKIQSLKKDESVTCVCTLLDEREGAGRIGKMVVEAGLAWIHVAFGSGDPERADPHLARLLFEKLEDALKSGKHVYIHCSAGIHRTGMLTNAFLRHLGYSAEDALSTLAALRTHTSEGVGEHRLAWGEQFYQGGEA